MHYIGFQPVKMPVFEKRQISSGGVSMKKTAKIALALIACLLLCAAALLSSLQIVAGKILQKSAAVYDLRDRDLTAQEAAQLKQQYPEKEILWSVPFQGAKYSSDITALTVTSLTAEEAKDLDAFSGLSTVEAAGCRDYDALLLLAQRRPDCRVHYTLTLNGKTLDSEITQISYSDDDIRELTQALAYLPKVDSVTLESQTVDAVQLSKLEESFPGIRWTVSMELGGQQIDNHTRQLDLSGVHVTFGELAQKLPLLQELKELNLTGCSLAEEELKSVISAYPAIRVQCILTFCGQTFSTDCPEIDLTEAKDVTAQALREGIPCFYQLKKVILGHTKISNEELDKINHSFPDTEVVWWMYLGSTAIRTDARFYYPAKVTAGNLPKNDEMKKLRYCTKLEAIDIGHSETAECDWLAYTPHVKYLIIADTIISDLSPLAGLKELVYLEMFRCRATDYTPLLSCTALQDLNLGGTFGDPDIIRQMTWLHNLYWARGLDEKEIPANVLSLADDLPDTNVEIHITGGNLLYGWRYVPHYYAFRDFIGAVFFNQDQTAKYWGEDAQRILQCDDTDDLDASQVLAEIVHERMERGDAIPGIKNIGSDKAQRLYESLKQG